MKTSKKEWQEKMKNLHTREKGISSEHQIPYEKLLSKVHIGDNVLDIGCGTGWLKSYLPPQTKYHGMDAFAMDIEALQGGIISGEIMQGEIDNFNWTNFPEFENIIETIFVFAALDGMRDLDKAFENMKKMAWRNIVILTGINIEPDQYHTHLITLEYIRNQMKGWKETYYQEIMKDKIVFLEYTHLPKIHPSL